MIETLLPQRYPFLFVDHILSADIQQTIGIKTYDHSFRFSQEYRPMQKIVPSVILIESLIQCGGAGVTQVGIFEKASWGIASLENVHFYDSVTLPATVNMVIKNLKVSRKALKQTGTASCSGYTILEATWLCLRL